MSGSITLNPYSVSTPQNSFLLQTQGYYSGVALDDPSSRNWLMGGYVDPAETVVLWGGVPIQERINVTGAGSEGVGPAIARSTSQATVTGFSVFDQAGSMVITPTNKVPVSAIRNYTAFYRAGTNARIVLACDPALVASIASGSPDINSQSLYWDVTNYRLTLVTTGGNFALPTSIKLLSTNTNSQVVTYSASTASWSAGSAAVVLI